MAFAVGVDVGSTKTTVAISAWDDDGDPDSESAQVATVVPSVVFLGEHHEMAIGDHAEKLGSVDPHRVIRDFKRRLGDPVPIIADGWCESTESVVAALIRRVIDEVTDRQNAAPDAIAVAYPAHWGPYKQALLAGALREAGLTDVLLVTEPAAAVTNAVPSTGEFATVLVYDLGAGSFDGAIMTRQASGEFRIDGIPQGLDWLGGDDFDQAIFSSVRHSAHLGSLDAADAELLSQMGRLRESCTVAKESLSLDTEVTIPVATPRFRTRIRMVRAEFEELIRDAIEDTLVASRRAITSAGLAVTDVDAIVLVGGSSRIPLVAQMLSEEFSLPIIVGGRPEASISQGAAMLAAATLRPTFAPLESGRGPAERAALAGSAEAGSDPATHADDVYPAAPPDHALPPIPPATGSEPPFVRQQGADHGRHRHLARRRWGLRTAGIVVAAGALIFAGSSLAASQADSTVSPTGGSGLEEPVQTTIATTTPIQTAIPPTTTPIRPAATAPGTTPAVGTTTLPPTTAAAATTTPAATVNAPAVVVDQAQVGGTDGSR